MKSLVLVIFCFLCASCSKTSSTTKYPSIKFDGLSTFSNVILNTQVFTNLVIENPTPVPLVPTFDLSQYYFITAASPMVCAPTFIPANTKCSFKVVFAPQEIGNFSSNFSIENLRLTISGSGVQPGLVSISPVGNTLVSTVAGKNNLVELIVSNSGQNEVPIPTLNTPSDVSISLNSCAATLATNQSCKISLIWTPTVASNAFTETITYFDNFGTNQSIVLSSQIVPSTPSGPINFTQQSQISNTNTSSNIIIGPIKDLYGNLVSDGEEIILSADNLRINNSAPGTTVKVYTQAGYVTIQASTVAVGSAQLFARTSSNFGTLNLSISN